VDFNGTKGYCGGGNCADADGGNEMHDSKKASAKGIACMNEPDKTTKA
jgi:hypothetical protein